MKRVIRTSIIRILFASNISCDQVSKKIACLALMSGSFLALLTRASLVMGMLLCCSICCAQPGYQADLNSLKTELQKSASFKAQITGNKRKEFDSLYQYLQSQNPDKRLDYFRNLASLLFSVQDYHLAFYEQPVKPFDKLEVTINLDSLTKQLILKPIESVEGIFKYDTLFEVGVYQVTPKQFRGVILKSKTSLWQPSEFAFELTHTTGNRYKAIYAHPVTKNLMFEGNEKYSQQTLMNSFFYASPITRKYSKSLAPDYSALPRDNNRFEFKVINESTSYLLFKSFQRNSATIAQATKLLDQVKSELKSQTLILDLRDNEGGSDLVAKKLYKALKLYRGKIYVLINNGTLSQAEIFTLKMVKLKNVTLVGQTTKGMLAYGSNYGKTITLPSGNFKYYPTDMRNSNKLLAYEGVGINPEIFLKNDQHWIDQILELAIK